MKHKAGWQIKSGKLTKQSLSEEEYWRVFNSFFRNGKKRNTYKFGLLKSILDNSLNYEKINNKYYLTYRNIFIKFTENYWNLVVKYNLCQMRKDGKSEKSKIEIILEKEVDNDLINYESLAPNEKEKIINDVEKECKQYVLGALYEDLEGCIYEFDLKKEGIYLSNDAFNFIFKYKPELENLNYYYWAKFLEEVNDETATTRLLDKLELSTPKRADLSIYKEILFNEFKENTCFYCGKKLTPKMHVDHFIPWSFTKEDKIWNFVLSCPTCNIKKSNHLAPKSYIKQLNSRNYAIEKSEINNIKNDFRTYTPDIIEKMWEYAKKSGYIVTKGNINE